MQPTTHAGAKVEPQQVEHPVVIVIVIATAAAAAAAAAAVKREVRRVVVKRVGKRIGVANVQLEVRGQPQLSRCLPHLEGRRPAAVKVR